MPVDTLQGEIPTLTHSTGPISLGTESYGPKVDRACCGGGAACAGGCNAGGALSGSGKLGPPGGGTEASSDPASAPDSA